MIWPHFLWLQMKWCTAKDPPYFSLGSFLSYIFIPWIQGIAVPKKEKVSNRPLSCGIPDCGQNDGQWQCKYRIVVTWVTSRNSIIIIIIIIIILPHAGSSFDDNNKQKKKCLITFLAWRNTYTNWSTDWHLSFYPLIFQLFMFE